MTGTPVAPSSQPFAATDGLPPSQEPPEIVYFNIGGRLFQLSEALLAKHPKSLLSVTYQNASATEDALDAEGNWYFDQDPYVFDCLLGYMRSGHVYLPPGIPMGAVLQAANYFRLDAFSNGLEAHFSGQGKPLPKVDS